MIKELITGLRSTLALWILTAIIYPFFMLFIGQAILPYQANGSIIKNDQGQAIGSALIGQTFTSAEYFRSRPSTTSYSEGKDAQPTGLSGASNLAPSNPDLIKRVEETIPELKQAGITPTADLVYTSGSSLDPHITSESAQAQIQTVATARAIAPQEIERLVQENTDRRFLGIFGEAGVNVLKLNLALDQLKT